MLLSILSRAFTPGLLTAREACPLAVSESHPSCAHDHVQWNDHGHRHGLSSESPPATVYRSVSVNEGIVPVPRVVEPCQGTAVGESTLRHRGSSIHAVTAGQGPATGVGVHRCRRERSRASLLRRPNHANRLGDRRAQRNDAHSPPGRRPAQHQRHVRRPHHLRASTVTMYPVSSGGTRQARDEVANRGRRPFVPGRRRRCRQESRPNPPQRLVAPLTVDVRERGATLLTQTRGCRPQP